ncbi:hydroxyacid dehydrogenase [Actinospica durhamensis]|uniref:Hydroxyacid dehydrogenase n=1 Tax=Actinospica durhamensis TaxID=1508375 RepID=A0A941ETI7_9ACTN|nr:hydroxyacid dehydrogenase [Actinospica durhamensis]MBR7836766.1 hydroxyacid dehydrogenase [Actinospica durhamensis]
MISKSEGESPASAPTDSAPRLGPRALLALDPGMTAAVFTAQARRRLEECVRLGPRTAVGGFDDPALREDLAACEVLITGWGSPRLGPAELELMPRLRHVVHCAGTVKALVDPAVFARGVTVSNAADANAVPVAEYTLAAVILGAKRAFTLAHRLSTGSVDEDGSHRDLTGLPWIGTRDLTVGVIGASRIGARVVRLVREVLGATVLLYDPYTDAGLTRDPGVHRSALPELLARCDVVSVHAPLTAETGNLLGAEQLALMPDGAVLINTARGGLVDTEALRREVLSGRIDAVLDVTEPEPLEGGDALYDAPNAFVTPHIAGALGNEVTRLGDLAVAEVERIAAGRPVRHAVDAAGLARIA